MKKLLKGFMTLMVVMGITTSAHADGWVRVSADGNPGNPIKAIVSFTNRTILNVPNDGCGGGSIVFYPTDFLAETYSATFLLINRASIEGKSLDIWVSCNGGARGSAVLFIQ